VRDEGQARARKSTSSTPFCSRLACRDRACDLARAQERLEASSGPERAGRTRMVNLRRPPSRSRARTDRGTRTSLRLRGTQRESTGRTRREPSTRPSLCRNDRHRALLDRDGVDAPRRDRHREEDVGARRVEEARDREARLVAGAGRGRRVGRAPPRDGRWAEAHDRAVVEGEGAVLQAGADEREACRVRGASATEPGE